MSWRTLLPSLISSGSFRTQADLQQAIESRTGEVLHQATVSRELANLGARKVGGVYRLPGASGRPAPIAAIRVTAGGCLVVVRTEAAFASVIGNRIDAAALDGVLGTIAGDDTVFVALDRPEVLDDLKALLGVLPEPAALRIA